jgi:hypothetical protein
VDIPVGQTKKLGNINVGNSQMIRVWAGSRATSQSDVTIRLGITIDVAQVTDLDARLFLKQGADYDRLYSVPGITLAV